MVENLEKVETNKSSARISVDSSDNFTKTIRPSVLPHDKNLAIYPLIVCLVIAGIGIVIKNAVVVILPLIVLAVFPGMPIFFHLLMYIFVKVELHPGKIVIKDYFGNSIVRSDRVQEMAYNEIAYIYYLAKEINLLMNLLKRLKRYNLLSKERDFTPESLGAKYGVPKSELLKFEDDSQNILNDYTATTVLIKLDDIYIKYNIPKKTAKSIKAELEKDESFNYEYIAEKLKDYCISTEDLNELKDEFSNIEADIVRPFLLTKVNLAKYMKVSGYRGGLATVKVDNTLVFANKDGTKKLYFVHFHDLSRQNCQSLIQTIINRNPHITFLMTKSEHKNLLK